MKGALFLAVASAVTSVSALNLASATYFKNIVLTPYALTAPSPISFEFVHEAGGEMTLSVLLSNSRFQYASIYSRYVSDATAVKSSFSMPASLFDSSGSCQLTFWAYRLNFEKRTSCTFYQQRTIQVSWSQAQEVASYFGPTTITKIDGRGQVRYDAEWLNTEGFYLRWVDTYHIGFTFKRWAVKPGDFLTAIQSVSATIQILTQSPHFALVDPSQTIKKKMELTFHLSEGWWRSSLSKTLYVLPESMMPSTQAIEGFTATETLYFPLNSFRDLSLLTFRLTVIIQTANRYIFTTDFYAETLIPLIGSCTVAKYCVLTR